MEKIFVKIGLIAAVVLPMWNIPLILRIYNRKSSKDISMYWALGVWTCLLLMVPSGLLSEDIVWKVFSVVNFAFFSIVAVFVVIYRK